MKTVDKKIILNLNTKTYWCKFLKGVAPHCGDCGWKRAGSRKKRGAETRPDWLFGTLAWRRVIGEIERLGEILEILGKMKKLSEMERCGGIVEILGRLQENDCGPFGWLRKKIGRLGPWKDGKSVKLSRWQQIWNYRQIQSFFGVSYGQNGQKLAEFWFSKLS